MAALRHGLKNFRKDSPNARVFTSYIIPSKDLKENTRNNCDELLSNDDENSQNFIIKWKELDDATSSGTATPVSYRRKRSQSSPPPGYEWCNAASAPADSEDDRTTPDTSWQHPPVKKHSTIQNRCAHEHGILPSLKIVAKKLEGILQSKKSQRKENEIKSQHLIKQSKKSATSTIQNCLRSMTTSLPSLAIHVTIPVPYKSEKTLHIVEHVTKNVESISFSELKNNKNVEAFCLRRQDRLRLKRPYSKLTSPRHLTLTSLTDEINISKSLKNKCKKYKNSSRNESKMTVISTFIQTKCNSDVSIFDLVNFISNSSYYLRHLEKKNKSSVYLNAIPKRNLKNSIKHNEKRPGSFLDKVQHTVNYSDNYNTNMKNEREMMNKNDKTHSNDCETKEELFNNNKNLLIGIDSSHNSVGNTPESLRFFDSVIQNNRYMTRINFSAEDSIFTLKQSFSDTHINDEMCSGIVPINIEKRQSSQPSLNVTNNNSNGKSSSQYTSSSTNQSLYAAIFGGKKLFSKPYEEMRKEYSTVNGFHSNFGLMDKGIPNEVLHSVLMTYVKENNNCKSKEILTKEGSKKNIFDTNTLRKSASDSNLSLESIKTNKSKRISEKQSMDSNKSDGLNFSFSESTNKSVVEDLINEINLKESFNIDIPANIRSRKHVSSSKQLIQIFLKHTDSFNKTLEDPILDGKPLDKDDLTQEANNTDMGLKTKEDENRIKTKVDDHNIKAKEDNTFESFVEDDENFKIDETMKKVIKTLSKENSNEIMNDTEQESKLLQQKETENVVLLNKEKLVEVNKLRDDIKGKKISLVEKEIIKLSKSNDDGGDNHRVFIEENNLESSSKIEKPITHNSANSSEDSVSCGDPYMHRMLERLKDGDIDNMKHDSTINGGITEKLKLSDISSTMTEQQNVNFNGEKKERGKYDFNYWNNENSAKWKFNNKSLNLINKDDGKNNICGDDGEKESNNTNDELVKNFHNKNITASFLKAFNNDEVDDSKSIFEAAANYKNRIWLNNNINIYKLNNSLKCDQPQSESEKTIEKFGFEIVNKYLRGKEIKKSQENPIQLCETLNNDTKAHAETNFEKKETSLIPVEIQSDTVTNNDNKGTEIVKNKKDFLDMSNKTLKNKNEVEFEDHDPQSDLKNNPKECTVETCFHNDKNHLSDTLDTDKKSIVHYSVTEMSTTKGTEKKRLNDKNYSESFTDEDNGSIEIDENTNVKERDLKEKTVKTEADLKMDNLCRLYNKYENNHDEAVLSTDFFTKKENIADYYLHNAFDGKKKINQNLSNKITRYNKSALFSLKKEKVSERKNYKSSNHMIYFNSKYLPTENEREHKKETLVGAGKYDLCQKKKNPKSWAQNQYSEKIEKKTSTVLEKIEPRKRSVAKTVLANNNAKGKKNVETRPPNKEMRTLYSQNHNENLVLKSDLDIEETIPKFTNELRSEENTNLSTLENFQLKPEIKSDFQKNIDNIKSEEKLTETEIKKSNTESKSFLNEENMTSQEKQSCVDKKPRSEAINLENEQSESTGKRKCTAESDKFVKENKINQDQERSMLHEIKKVEPESINHENNKENSKSLVQPLSKNDANQEVESSNFRNKERIETQDQVSKNRISKLDSESKFHASKKNKGRIFKSKTRIQKPELEFKKNEENSIKLKKFLSYKIQKLQPESHWKINEVKAVKMNAQSVKFDKPDLFPTSVPIRRVEKSNEIEQFRMVSQNRISLNQKGSKDPDLLKETESSMSLNDIILEKKGNMEKEQKMEKKNIMEKGMIKEKEINMKKEEIIKKGMIMKKGINTEKEMQKLIPSSDKEEAINVNYETSEAQSTLKMPSSNVFVNKKGDNFENRLRSYKDNYNSEFRSHRFVRNFIRPELEKKVPITYEDVIKSVNHEAEINKIENLERKIKSHRKKNKLSDWKTKDNNNENVVTEDGDTSFDFSSRFIKKVVSDPELMLKNKYLNTKKKTKQSSVLHSLENSRELVEALQSKENETNSLPDSQAGVEKIAKLRENDVRNVLKGKKIELSNPSLSPSSPSFKKKKTDEMGFAKLKLQEHLSKIKTVSSKNKRNVNASRGNSINETETKSSIITSRDSNFKQTYSKEITKAAYNLKNLKNKILRGDDLLDIKEIIPLEGHEDANHWSTDPSVVVKNSKKQSEAKKSFYTPSLEPSDTSATITNPLPRPLYDKNAASKNLEYLKKRIIKIENENKIKSRRMQEKDISHYDFSARVSHPEQLFSSKGMPKLDYSAMEKVPKNQVEKNEDHLIAFNSFHSNIKQRINQQYNDTDIKKDLKYRYNVILDKNDKNFQRDEVNKNPAQQSINKELDTPNLTSKENIKFYAIENENYDIKSNQLNGTENPIAEKKDITEPKIIISTPNDLISKKPENDSIIFNNLAENSSLVDLIVNSNKNEKPVPVFKLTKKKDNTLSNELKNTEARSMTNFISTLKDKTYKLLSSTNIIEHLTKKQHQSELAIDSQPYSHLLNALKGGKNERRATSNSNKIVKGNVKTNKDRKLSAKELLESPKSFSDSRKHLNEVSIDKKYREWNNDVKSTQNVSSNRQILVNKTKENGLEKKWKTENTTRPKSTHTALKKISALLKNQSKTNESIAGDKKRSVAPKKEESWVTKTNLELIGDYNKSIYQNRNESLNHLEDNPTSSMHLQSMQVIKTDNKAVTEKFQHTSKIPLTISELLRNNKFYRTTNHDVNDNEYKQYRLGEKVNNNFISIKKNDSAKVVPFKTKIPLMAKDRKNVGRINSIMNHDVKNTSHHKRLGDSWPKKETNYARNMNKKNTSIGNNKKNHLSKISQKQLDYIKLTDFSKSEPLPQKTIIEHFSLRKIEETSRSKKRFKNLNREKKIMVAKSLTLPMTKHRNILPKHNVVKQSVKIHPTFKNEKLSKLYDLYNNDRSINYTKSGVQSYANVKHTIKNVDNKIAATNSQTGRSSGMKALSKTLKISLPKEQQLNHHKPYNGFFNNSSNYDDDDNGNNVKKNLINYFRKDRQKPVTEVKRKPPFMLNRNISSQNNKSNKYSNQQSKSRIYSVQHKISSDKNKLSKEIFNSMLPIRNTRQHINRRYLSDQKCFLISIKDNSTFTESISQKEHKSFETKIPLLSNYSSGVNFRNY